MSDLCGLKFGKFYEDKKYGGLYFLAQDDCRVTSLPDGARLDPTRTPDTGLAGVFHKNEVDVRGFQEVNPLQYIDKRKAELDELLRAVKEHCPALGICRVR